MLHGERITLRPVRATDLDAMYAAHTEIRTRGRFFPLGVMSETKFKSQFAEHGYWDREEGMLVIESPQGEIAGHIEFFRPVSYWDAWELSYQLYDERFAGHGFMTEAVQLLTDYLYDTKKINRIHLVIHPDNAASRRIAEKCGFQLEGTLRDVWFNEGRNQDAVLYSLVRDDPRPWHGAAPGG